eukprot:2981806-Pyramimonas_sp.AAC.1
MRSSLRIARGCLLHLHAHPLLRGEGGRGLDGGGELLLSSAVESSRAMACTITGGRARGIRFAVGARVAPPSAPPRRGSL